MKGLHEGVQYIVVVKANNRLGSSRRAVLVVRTLGTSKLTPVNNAHPVNACKLSITLRGSKNIHFLCFTAVTFFMTD